ncbi:hypothetical protein EVAR_17195_1 [Eumeta japonica]|uniref:Uncharacterized protein n=1 Tax=Eumeta variegata TaxID=151549 RepID=A0A4C1U911_EUMVA|nr:hypothetical protein EVAR_17195_1 [Eumeta japonica]
MIKNRILQFPDTGARRRRRDSPTTNAISLTQHFIISSLLQTRWLRAHEFNTPDTLVDATVCMLLRMCLVDMKRT